MVRVLKVGAVCAALTLLTATAEAQTTDAVTSTYLPAYKVIGANADPWAKIFQAIGISEAKQSASIIVAGKDANVDVMRLAEHHLVVIEGTGDAARRAGVRPGKETVVRQIEDRHAPAIEIVWQEATATQAVELPAGFTVFATDKISKAPLLAGRRTAGGGLLWMATSPGITGTERYPFLLQALVELGLTLPSRSSTLWAFFDSSYRLRADVDYLAKRWRKTGISALHVAAWHNMEANAEADAYLKNLIEACHRNAIVVYAWLELPHISEKFWEAHPAWREKTAAGQDAHLDWRKLMNLRNSDCAAAVAIEVNSLMERFNWDGVNLAELYFESLEGASNPARFTPMNAEVRQEFQKQAGFDPLELFKDGNKDRQKNPQALREFLNYRAELASKMQEEWMNKVDSIRKKKPYMDLVLTHIDDRFEHGMRDALGADVERTLPLMKASHSTLLVEDPATLWDLGAERYAKLAAEYRKLPVKLDDIAVDINVVERYQDVYPTKKQTGTELLQLVKQASTSFGNVALYFENSLEKQDMQLLPVAASMAVVKQEAVDELQVTGPKQENVAWRGPVEINGRLWPMQAEDSVLVPAGRHKLTAATGKPAFTISDFNGNVETAQIHGNRVDVSYRSRTRAIATTEATLTAVEVDGSAFWKTQPGEKHQSFMLPAGQHVVTFRCDQPVTTAAALVSRPPRD